MLLAHSEMLASFCLLQEQQQEIGADLIAIVGPQEQAAAAQTAAEQDECDPQHSAMQF
jgi:hypothetical protein